MYKFINKRNLAIIYLLILSIGTILSLYIPKNEVTASEATIIPNDAIRLRILANSDSKEDQEIKRLVRDEVNKQITEWVTHLTSKAEARTVIQDGMPEIQEIAENVLKEQNVNQTVKVEFGKVEFPTKLYGQFLYPAGEYEAILITLGEGVGANWWCVLFPPLCFLDFSNGVAVSEGFDEEEEKKETPVKEEKASAKEEAVAEVKNSVKEEPVQEGKSSVKEAPVQEVKNSVKEEPVQEGKSSVKEAPVQEGKNPVKEAPVQEMKNPIKEEAVQVDKKSIKEETIQEDKSPAKEPVQEDKNTAKEEPPVYTSEDEEPVKVKFFIVEIFNKIFS